MGCEPSNESAWASNIRELSKWLNGGETPEMESVPTKIIQHTNWTWFHAAKNRDLNKQQKHIIIRMGSESQVLFVENTSQIPPF